MPWNAWMSSSNPEIELLFYSRALFIGIPPFFIIAMALAIGGCTIFRVSTMSFSLFFLLVIYVSLSVVMV